MATMLASPNASFGGESRPAFANTTRSAAQSVDIEAFVREGCPHCVTAEAFLASGLAMVGLGLYLIFGV